MAFCGKCGREVPPGDAFCRECGAPVAEPAAPPPPVTAPAPPAPAPAPAPAAPPPAPPAAPAAKPGVPVWVWIVAGVLVLALAGGAIAFFVLAPMRRATTVSSADPGSLGFDAEPFDPASISATATAVETSVAAETATDVAAAPVEAAPAPEAEVAPAPMAAPELTQEGAIDVVGNMLNNMHEGKQKAALALVTKNMLADVSNDKTWFSPGPDVLISFEVQDATAKGDTMRVRVLEQWNSGPEKTTYTVVMTDTDGPKVDGIKWSSW